MKNPGVKLSLVVVIAALVGAAFYFELHTYLTLESLQNGLERFRSAFENNPILVIAVFMAVYIAVAALSIPGAVPLTLLSGALFGLVAGTIIVSFASTIGATLAFLASRYVLRDSVRSKFGDKLKKIDQGVERDGAFYLFTLRLVPVFPFVAINLLMGLTNIKAWTFYLVSQMGMLVGTAIYVNAGTQLAELESVSGILSLPIILSFVLLGLFPLIAKKIVGWIKARRVYKDYKKPKHFDRNLIVIGAGAGGLVTSYIAATVKAKVTLVEAGKMGGDCLNYGCVPSKAIIKSAKVANQQRHASIYGLEDSEPTFSFKKVMQRVHQVIADIEPHDSVERYTKLGVDVVKGYAKLLDPWTVEIAREDGQTQKLTARSIVLATGARPFVPPLPGLEEVGYVTSDTLWETFAKRETVPSKLVVLGGGPIGCELSQAFARLGANVTQVERGERVMGREDDDVAKIAIDSMTADGVNILAGHDAVRCELREGNKYLIVKHGDAEKAIEFDELICAVGRAARLEGYGLEELGIETKRTIVTNDYLETLYPNIFAAGDVAGPYQFTHFAAHQAWYAAVNALFGSFKKFAVDYRVLPWTTFVDPEIARVGLNEQDAKAQGIAYEVTQYPIDDLDRAIAESATKGVVKVLTPPGKDKILGVTVVGDRGGDIIAEFVLAMKHNLGLNKVLGTIHAYPTWAEANKYAAGEWKRANKPEKILAWLEKYHTWRRGNPNETGKQTDQQPSGAFVSDSGSSDPAGTGK